MLQPFATDNRLCEANIQLVVTVKMGKRSASKAKGRKSIGATGQWPIFHPELLHQFDKARAESSHITCTYQVLGGTGGGISL